MNSERNWAPMLALIVILLAPLALYGADPLIPLRVGGQPTTPITSHVSHVFLKTDILERNGFRADLKFFSSGAAVNEALTAGAIDVGFNGDMPSLALAMAHAPVKVIGRQSQFRAALMATTKSNIKTLADLKGKQVFGPYGTSIHPMALDMLRQVGLRPGQDCQFVNMSPPDIADAVNSGRIEAFGLWDPWVENWRAKKLARVLKEDLGGFLVLVMRADYVKAHPRAPEQFLRAHKEAVLFSAQNKELVNKWFLETPAAKALSTDVIEKATEFDPQWFAKSIADVRVTFTEPEMKLYYRMAERTKEVGIFPQVPPIGSILDFTAAKKVDATPWGFNPKTVKIVKQ